MSSDWQASQADLGEISDLGFERDQETGLVLADDAALDRLADREWVTAGRDRLGP